MSRLDKPNPLMAIESRPSSFTGVSWWVCLAYKEHHFEEMLPPDLMGMADEERNAVVEIARKKLKARLKPILIAEDAPKLKLVDLSRQQALEGFE